MNIWHDIKKDRIKPNDFMAVIEISKGSNIKYRFIPRIYGDVIAFANTAGGKIVIGVDD